MGFVVQYSPNPETLGAYAFRAGAEPAKRQNLQRSIDNAQQAAQFNAQQRQHAIDRSANMFDRQQGRAAELEQNRMQQAGYALKNAADTERAKIAAEADLQQEQMQQQGMRAQRYDAMVQQGLKDGTLYHTPQMKQQMAEIQRSIGAIYADTSIAPEQQDAMADRLYQRMRGIVPAVRNQEDIPTPLHQRLAESTGIMTHDGTIIPGGTRPPQEGEWIGTQVIRNGSPQTQWKQVPYRKDTGDNWDSQKFVAQQREVVRRGIMEQKNAEYDRSLRAWEARQKRYESAKESGYEAADPGDPPSPPSVQDWEVDGKLHEISGGLAGSAKPVQRPPSWPRPAMMGGYTPVPAMQQGGSLSPGAPFANDPGRSPPVTVSSEAEALRQPVGTVVILNGRKFVVGE